MIQLFTNSQFFLNSRVIHILACVTFKHGITIKIDNMIKKKKNCKKSPPIKTPIQDTYDRNVAWHLWSGTNYNYNAEETIWKKKQSIESNNRAYPRRIASAIENRGWFSPRSAGRTVAGLAVWPCAHRVYPRSIINFKAAQKLHVHPAGHVWVPANARTHARTHACYLAATAAAAASGVRTHRRAACGPRS